MPGFGRLIWLYCLEVLDHFQSSGIDPAPVACLLLASGFPEVFPPSGPCAAILEAMSRAATGPSSTVRFKVENLLFHKVSTTTRIFELFFVDGILIATSATEDKERVKTQLKHRFET